MRGVPLGQRQVVGDFRVVGFLAGAFFAVDVVFFAAVDFFAADFVGRRPCAGAFFGAGPLRPLLREQLGGALVGQLLDVVALAQRRVVPRRR